MNFQGSAQKMERQLQDVIESTASLKEPHVQKYLMKTGKGSEILED